MFKRLPLPPKSWRSSNIIVRTWAGLATGTFDRQIFRATIIVGAMTLLARLAYVARDLFVAWRFGRSSSLEAFVIAFAVPYTLTNALTISLTATFLPEFIKFRESGQYKAAQELYSGLLAWLILISGAVTFLCVVAEPFYVRIVAASFSKENWNLIYFLLCLTAPAAFLNSVVVFWQAVLNAEEKFFLSAAVSICTPLISIGLLFFSLNTGVLALSLGLLSGAMVEVFILGVAVKRANAFLLPRWRGFSAPVRDALGQWGRLVVSAFFTNAMSLADQSMAARRAEPGSVAALSYGRKAVTFPLDLSSIAVVTAVSPYFSKMAAAHDWVGLRKTLHRCLLLIFVITFPVVCVLVIWAEPIIKLLFERGAFTASDTEIVARVLSYYAFLLPSYVAFFVMMKLLPILRENVSAIWFSGIGLLLNIILNYLFSKQMGVVGIALATSCVYAIMTLSLYIYARRLLGEKAASS